MAESWTIQVTSQSLLLPEVQLALGVYKAERKIDAYHVTIPKRRQRGHPEHSSYIKERDRTIDLEQSEDEEDGKGTKRPRQSSEARSTSWRARTMVPQAASFQL